MSVEFRQRTAGEFVAMLKRRKWFILLPVVTMTVAIGYVVYKLPSVYESKTLLTVKPPTISDIVVKPLTDEDLSQRLQTINQEVLSRSSLEPMITKFDLFKIERNNGMDTAEIVDRMRKNITVEVEKSDNEKLAAFRIAYRDREPNATRNVTSELAAKYVNAQVLASTQIAEKTREFIENELKTKKEVLDNLEKQRLEIMMQNVETLPESSQGLIAQLDGLRKREDTIAKEKETLTMEKGRLNDQISANNRQIRVYDEFGEKETKEAAELASRIEDTPAYAQLVQKRADLKGQLDKLLKVFKEKHPDVVAKKDEIARIDEEIENLRKNTDQRVKLASQSSSRKADLQRKNIELENQRLQNQIELIDGQMRVKDQELGQNSGQITEIESKINQIPNVKVALEGLSTQYQSAKQAYDDLLKKSSDASMQFNREENAQGETIRVQDAANLPESPVAPKRALLTGFGAAIGLAIGLLLAAVFELPRIFKIQNIEDAKHYTGLPVLAAATNKSVCRQ
ncbi:MAG TPA: Wzz/FepE/Etk N-terminal domain-containing protein, partial [Pyrinomonadaceae bacterium]|nr:Wzz/FepE/Etk N-terminal domain-containing protein [Pyrinomonadaceae bacterium]